jgi:hypothetical protein
MPGSMVPSNQTAVIQEWQHGDVTSTPGHPPLDFPLVGLSKWPDPKWVNFFEGEHGKAVRSVLLAHSLGEDGLIVVKTAPRPRWDGDVEATDFAFGLLLWIADSARPAPEGEASLKGEERGSYNKGVVTFAENHAAEWEAWEPARWRLGGRNIESRVFRFAHAWTGLSVDDPDRYIGVIAYNVVDTNVSLDEVDGGSYDFDFSKAFGIEDLQAQVGSKPNVESIIRAPTRHPDHEAVIGARIATDV